MTTTNMIEEIQLVFPSLGETLIVYELKKAERDFVSKTYLLSETYADWDENTDLSILSPEFYAIKTINFYDSNDDLRDSNYRIKDSKIEVGNDEVTSWDGEYYCYPDPDSFPTIPEQFHEALIYYVLKKQAVRVQDSNARIYFSEYKDAVKEAKKYANTEGLKGGLVFQSDLEL